MDLLDLLPGHPGRVAWADQDMAMVDWVDRTVVTNQDGVFTAIWLKNIDAAAYRSREESLRASSWSGFPNDMAGARAGEHTEVIVIDHSQGR